MGDEHLHAWLNEREDDMGFGWSDYDDSDDRPATQAEAHVEWHINAGVPMGQPCPWDACHDNEYEVEDQSWRDEDRPREEDEVAHSDSTIPFIPDPPNQPVSVDPGDLSEVLQAAEAYASYVRNNKHRRHVDHEDAARYQETADRIDKAIHSCRATSYDSSKEVF